MGGTAEREVSGKDDAMGTEGGSNYCVVLGFFGIRQINVN